MSTCLATMGTQTCAPMDAGAVSSCCIFARVLHALRSHSSFLLFVTSLISYSSPSSAATVPTAAMLLFLKSCSSSILLQSHPHGRNHRPPCSATLPVSSTAVHQCCACPNLPSKQPLSAELLGHRMQLRPQALTFGVWMAVTRRISCWCVQINSGTLGSRFGQQTAMLALLRQARRCCCNRCNHFLLSHDSRRSVTHPAGALPILHQALCSLRLLCSTTPMRTCKPTHYPRF